MFRNLDHNFPGGYPLPQHINAVLHLVQSTLKHLWIRLGLELAGWQSGRNIIAPDSVADVQIHETGIKAIHYCRKLLFHK